jgi:hypothetical protein
LISHRDEQGNVCTRHEPTTDALLAWAAVGSRISGFHHDSASKLQSLLMAIDEAADVLGDERPDVQRALDTAMTSLRELHGLLTENRALAKAPQPKTTPVSEIVRRAAARYSIKLGGDAGAQSVFVAPPSIIHAISLLLDACAGPKQGPRAVDVAGAEHDGMVELSIVPSGGGTASAANESIAVAAFLIAREAGELRCSANGFVVQLPVAAASTPRSAGDKE